MRVAISGSHGVGKSTLIGELAAALPHYAVFDEPYYALLAEGYEFAASPTTDELEELVHRACESLTRTAAHAALFDRCPADYYAYLLVTDPHRILGRSDLFEEVATAMASLDLVVFVPIEQPDRIHIDGSESPKLRRRVDALMRELLVEDSWELGVRTLEVNGSPADRARQVLAQVDASEFN